MDNMLMDICDVLEEHFNEEIAKKTTGYEKNSLGFEWPKEIGPRTFSVMATYRVYGLDICIWYKVKFIPYGSALDLRYKLNIEVYHHPI